MRYDFTIFHTLGTQIYLADALSRPAAVATVIEQEVSEKVENFIVRAVQAQAELEDLVLQELREAGDNDELYCRVREEVRKGWRESGRSYKGEIRRYFTQKEQLVEASGLLMRGPRLVVPEKMREEVMERLHKNHQSFRKCMARAKDSVWWPQMGKQLSEFVDKCETCIRKRRIRHYPLINSTLPEEPWNVVASDLFEFQGKDFLLVVDYFSRWIEVTEIGRKTAECIVRHMKTIFTRYGRPVMVRTDNGPCYCGAAFGEFLRGQGIRHVTSSAHYPESNGLAERAVGTIKRLWQGGGDKEQALLTYRNTPLDSGASPEQLFMGRSLRVDLPIGTDAIDLETFRRKDEELKRAQKEQADRRRRAKPAADLQEGDRVWVKTSEEDAGKEGVIMRKREEEESYDVEVGGKILRRNRKHLRKLSAPNTPHQEENAGEMSEGTLSDSEEEEPHGEGEGPRRSCRAKSQNHFMQDFEYY
jgi:transposase InsO family protein